MPGPLVSAKAIPTFEQTDPTPGGCAVPDHIAFILRHGLIGFALALIFVAMLLAFDVAGLWHLVTHTADGPIAVIMLVVFFTITFGAVQIGYQIMMLGEDDDDDDDQGGLRQPIPIRLSDTDRR